MANLYLELKNKHQREVDNFPMGFAFNDEQFNEGMKKLGLEPDEKDKIIGIGAGGFILRSDVEAFKSMFSQHKNEMKSAINSSDQFIFDMFNYELANHEYIVTYEVEDTLEALGLTIEEVESDERLLNGLKKAIQNQQEAY